MTPRPRSTKGAALAILVAWGAPRVAGAQGSNWEQQVRNQLQRAAATLRDQGFTRVVATRTSTLNGEESERFPVTLVAGVAYSLIGVCDNDCARLDLVLVNASGNDVAADRGRDNVPVLRFTPPRTMEYRVKIVMAACQMNPCWYGIALYRR